MHSSYKNGISVDGAGYKINKKVWMEARDKGLEKAILERIKLFDRSVSVELLTQRIADKGFGGCSEDDVLLVLERLAEQGEVIKDGNNFRAKNIEHIINNKNNSSNIIIKET